MAQWLRGAWASCRQTVATGVAGEYYHAEVRRELIIVEAVWLEQPMKVHVLEGDMHGDAGDWLVTGVAGEQYIAQQELFELLYEPVDSSAYTCSTGIAALVMYQGGFLVDKCAAKLYTETTSSGDTRAPCGLS
ncbi:MAG: hypothetical protein NZ741_12030 [Armatimonadetes bacterium]|nr:hypothetical protein [Armatimonadota bacterium]